MPLKSLIHRQVDIERITHIEATREGDIRLGTLGHNDIRDMHITDIGSLLELELHGVVRSVNHGLRLDAISLEAHDIELYNGIGNIILDAATKHNNEGTNAQKSKYITHNYFFLLFHKCATTPI